MSKNASINVGENIKALRKAKKMTQDELADAIGKSRRTIIGYENGSIDVSFSVMLEIANALECCVSEIISEGVKIPNSELFDPDSSALNDLLEEAVLKPALADFHDSYKVTVTGDALDLLNSYSELNLEGRVEARKRIKEMTLLEKYTKLDCNPSLLEKFEVETNNLK